MIFLFILKILIKKVLKFTVLFRNDNMGFAISISPHAYKKTRNILKN